MTDIILHHYWPSTVAEKVRTSLGIKKLQWRSVEIPRLPPKPQLTPLTGGYRRTPVMQIGADIYCDSRCIIEEINARFPENSSIADADLATRSIINRWGEVDVFNSGAGAVISDLMENLPPEWVEDRLRLYYGPTKKPDELAAERLHLVSQCRVLFSWVEQLLNDTRPYLLGQRPDTADSSVYYVVWAMRNNFSGGPELFIEFPLLTAWADRVEAIGYGEHSDMSADEALRIARDYTPDTPETDDPRDPQGLRPGTKVSVRPAGDGGDPDVVGEVVLLRTDRIALRHHSAEAGDIVIHFPRLGYHVSTI